MQRTRIAVGRARGFAFGSIPDDVARRLPNWIATGRVDEGLELKPGRAYRYGPWMVKLDGRGGARDWMRASPALRSASAHFRLLPVRTPRPLVALEWRSFRALEGSILVSEFVEGSLLSEVWERDERATRALPAFMAELHARPYLHGDLHPYNLIWTGAEWVLIDLDSLRHRLHSIRKRSVIEMQWARIFRNLAFDESVHRSFDEYLRAGRFDWPKEATWNAIAARARAMPPVATAHQWVSAKSRSTHGA